MQTPFLDIRDLVLAPPDAGAGGEQGLFSVAFAPDYGKSRRFYVAYTNQNWAIEINEFRRSANSKVSADPASRRVLLVIPHGGAQNHNGGQLQFGPDNLLYISTGDGGNVSPLGEAARKLNSLLGKILRISPLPTGSRPYGIPKDNPFVGKKGRNEIFAYGLRNPWRFSFDDRLMAIADVGRAQREEVNILRKKAVAGTNFGWPQYEGDIVFDSNRPGPHPPKFPIFTYDHSGGRCAIIGGHVVRGPDLPLLEGRYLYGDLCTGEVRSFAFDVAAQTVRRDRFTGLKLPGLSSFGVGVNGKLYAAQIGGTVSRLEPGD